MSADNPTARLPPPEFLAFGLNKDTWRPWNPADNIAIFKLLSFHLSWNWMNDLSRESFRQRHPDLEEFVEEINPFYAGNLHTLVTVLEDEDLK